MKSKRLWTLLAAVLISAVILGACSPKGVTPLPEPTRATSVAREEKVHERIVKEIVEVEVEKPVPTRFPESAVSTQYEKRPNIILVTDCTQPEHSLRFPLNGTPTVLTLTPTSSFSFIRQNLR